MVQASPNPAASQPLAAPPGLAGTIQDQDPKKKAILSRDAALLPPGPGRDVTIRACSTCHALDIVTNQRLTPQEWTNVLQTMSAKGRASHSRRVECDSVLSRQSISASRGAKIGCEVFP